MQPPNQTTFAQKTILVFFGLVLTEIIFQVFGLLLAHPVDGKTDFVGDPDAVRILTIGESTTEWGGSNSYPSRLEVRLANLIKDKKIKIYNEGHAGSNTHEILQRIPIWMQKYRPNIVITMMGINDPWGITISESPVLSALDHVKLFKLMHLGWINFQAAQKGKVVRARVRKDIGISDKYPDLAPEGHDPEIESTEIGEKFKQAEVLFDSKNYRNAVAVLEQTMKVARRRYPQYLFKLGLAKYYSGQVEGGDRAFDEFVKLRHSSNAYFSVGSFIYFLHGASNREGREKAIRYLKAGYDLNPKNTEILSLLGTAYRQNPATIDEALKYLTSCIGLDCRNPDAIGSLADIYRIQHRWEEAEDILKIGIAETDTETTYFLWDRYIRQLMERQRWKDAESVLQRALQKYPDNFAFRLLAKEIEAKLGNQRKESNFSLLEFNFWELPATKRNYPAIIEQIELGHAIPVIVQYPRRPIEPLRSLLRDQSGIVYVENLKNFETALQTQKYEDLFIDKFAQNFGHFTLAGSELIVDEIVREFKERHLLFANSAE